MIGLIGRSKEKTFLFNEFDSARNSYGRIILVAGEAGIGKTMLVEETLLNSGLKTFITRTSEEGTPPYGPITYILRNCMRESGLAKIDCGPLTNYLAAILPELGDPPKDVDSKTLKESITSALLSISSEKPTAIFIDDLQWADNATIDLLASISEKLSYHHLIILCTYRSDEVTRNHGIKKLKSELRRRRKLNELVIESLSFDDTATLIEKLLQDKPSEELVREIYERTQGLPLFIEELVTSLRDSGYLNHGSDGVTLSIDHEIPLPETIKDAVLNHITGLSKDAIIKIEIAAVAGAEFDMDLVIKISGNENGIDDLIKKKLIKETGNNRAEFKHTLIREAIKSEIIWSRRRSLHKNIAEHFEEAQAHPELIAEHWLAANESEKACSLFASASELSCKVHAYGDATVTANRALEIWPKGKEEVKRIETLMHYAKCSHLSGNLNEAVKALREIIDGSFERIEKKIIGEAYRMLANIYALKGSWELSISSRISAAGVFEENNLLADAASELLIAAGRNSAMLNLTNAYDLSVKSAELADKAGNLEINTQALSLSGNVLSMLGKFEEEKKLSRMLSPSP